RMTFGCSVRVILNRCVAGMERRLLLSPTHAVRSQREFGGRHPEAAIYQETAIFLWDDHIVLLSQIPDDLVNGTTGCRIVIAMCRRGRRLTTLFAPFGNLLGAAHAQSLNLLRRKPELESKLCIARSFGNAVQKSLALILRKGNAAAL